MNAINAEARNQLTAYGLTPPTGMECRPPIMTMWTQVGGAAVPLSPAEPWFSATWYMREAVADRIEGVVAVSVTCEVWTCRDDGSGRTPEQRRAEGDPLVSTAITSLVVDAYGVTSIVAFESIDDNGVASFTEPATGPFGMVGNEEITEFVRAAQKVVC